VLANAFAKAPLSSRRFCSTARKPDSTPPLHSGAVSIRPASLIFPYLNRPCLMSRVLELNFTSAIDHRMKQITMLSQADKVEESPCRHRQRKSISMLKHLSTISFF
jgi:hypothetical protein